MLEKIDKISNKILIMLLVKQQVLRFNDFHEVFAIFVVNVFDFVIKVAVKNFEQVDDFVINLVVIVIFEHVVINTIKVAVLQLNYPVEDKVTDIVKVTVQEVICRKI